MKKFEKCERLLSLFFFYKWRHNFSTNQKILAFGTYNRPAFLSKFKTDGKKG